MTSRDASIPWRADGPAAWPAAPLEMSVSAHDEIDECPRRWALASADYPELWARRGYPPKVQVAALAGSVVHVALEIIAKRFTRAGVPSVNDPLATQVLRELGGYTRVVEGCIEQVLRRFADNPRARPLMEHARRTLRGQVPTLRARVQAMVARIRLSKGAKAAPVGSGSVQPSLTRAPLTSGMHPEVELRAKSIGWKGKADLLVIADDGCEIVDFKTGAVDEAHAEQVRVYAVLWRLDEELNPAGLVAERLALAYDNHNVDVAAPSEDEISALSEELVARRESARAALATNPPAARPGPKTCRYCSVRHLCDEYWAGAAQAVSEDGRFGDVELVIVHQHGATSWDSVVIRGGKLKTDSAALLRLQEPLALKPGTRLRVLDGAIARDPDDAAAPAIVTLGAFSEAYRVA